MTSTNTSILIGSQKYPFKTKTKKVSHTLSCVIDLPHLILHRVRHYPSNPLYFFTSQTRLQVTPTNSSQVRQDSTDLPHIVKHPHNNKIKVLTKRILVLL